MEIKKINMDEQLITKMKSVPEIMGLKKYLEQNIKSIAPNINIELDMRLNLIVDGDNYGIAFDEMALLEPMRNLLGINLVTGAVKDQIETGIKACIPAQIAKLKNVQNIEQLTYMFPTLHSIFKKKENDINTSLIIEQNFQKIKPAKDSEILKQKELHKLGINTIKHNENLKEAQTFSLTSFVSTYADELEHIYDNLANIIGFLNSMVISNQPKISQNAKELMSVIASSTGVGTEKSRGI